VLDDDPTGTQTVHDVTVLTGWSAEALEGAFRESDEVVYVLTNSRSLTATEAQSLSRQIAAGLLSARQATGRQFAIVSRSDSTLRGHFPDEVQALAEGLGEAYDGTLIIPFFLEGGRYTIDDAHYVAERSADEEWLVPAAETEYARDAAFGYRSSNLREWVSEKSRGSLLPGDVFSIRSKSCAREGRGSRPPAAFDEWQEGVRGEPPYLTEPGGFVSRLLDAGRRSLLPPAASFVRVRGGIEPQGLPTEPIWPERSTRRA
jgi:hypothetical protein